MIGIQTVHILAGILTVHHTQIRRGTGTAVLDTLAADTGFVRPANVATSATVTAIHHQVCRLDTVDA